HIGGRALTTLDFDRLHAALDQCRQDIERVETRRLLDRMIRVAFDFEATLAERRIPRRLAGRIAVYEHAVEAGLQAFRRFEPSDRVGGRAYPVRVRRLPGHVRGERATSFDHDAQAAEPEYFDLHGSSFDQSGHLRARENTREHGALDAELSPVEFDGSPVRCRALHAQ